MARLHPGFGLQNLPPACSVLNFGCQLRHDFLDSGNFGAQSLLLPGSVQETLGVCNPVLHWTQLSLCPSLRERLLHTATAKSNDCCLQLDNACLRRLQLLVWVGVGLGNHALWWALQNRPNRPRLFFCAPYFLLSISATLYRAREKSFSTVFSIMFHPIRLFALGFSINYSPTMIPNTILPLSAPNAAVIGRVGRFFHSCRMPLRGNFCAAMIGHTHNWSSHCAAAFVMWPWSSSA